MQPRLMRSTTERMVAGVCGGLGTYFAIDPVIVRLIFVVVTFSSGMGLPVYIILLLLMPREPRQNVAQSGHQQHRHQRRPVPHATRQRAHEALPPQHTPAHLADEPVGRVQHSWHEHGHEVLVSQPARYHAQQAQQAASAVGMRQQPPAASPADTLSSPATTQQSSQPWPPATGQTIKIDPAAAQSYGQPRQHARQHAPAQTPPQPATRGQRPRRSWRTLGLILLGVGAFVLLQEITGLGMSLGFPALLIIIGIVLLARSRQR
jgi:phage shock protein C